jgi:hypothetical protein
MIHTQREAVSLNERSKEIPPQDFPGKLLVPRAIVSDREFPVSDEQVVNQLITSLGSSATGVAMRPKQVRENGGSKRKVRIIVPEEVGSPLSGELPRLRSFDILWVDSTGVPDPRKGVSGIAANKNA